MLKDKIFTSILKWIPTLIIWKTAQNFVPSYPRFPHFLGSTISISKLYPSHQSHLRSHAHSSPSPLCLNLIVAPSVQEAGDDVQDICVRPIRLQISVPKPVAHPHSHLFSSSSKKTATTHDTTNSVAVRFVFLFSFLLLFWPIQEHFWGWIWLIRNYKGVTPIYMN